MYHHMLSCDFHVSTASRLRTKRDYLSTAQRYSRRDSAAPKGVPHTATCCGVQSRHDRRVAEAGELGLHLDDGHQTKALPACMFQKGGKTKLGNMRSARPWDRPGRLYDSEWGCDVVMSEEDGLGIRVYLRQSAKGARENLEEGIVTVRYVVGAVDYR